ncbi:fatty acid desaturase [Solirubrobacter taibaiensis]|nr:fatty acid desaturase [Solirubrobacter taibaiensis]
MSASEFSLREAHQIVADLFAPRMTVYWTDLLLSLTIGAGASVAAASASEPWSVPCLLVAVLALYRAAAFIHEIIHHQRRPAFRSFRIAWNLLCGVPLLVPSFLYENHLEHHSRHEYGTSSDGEYIPFAQRSPWSMVGFLLASPLVPLVTVYRFALLAPLSWAYPRLRGTVYRRASSLRIDIEYEWHEPTSPEQRRRWVLQESACFVLVWIVILLTATGVFTAALVLQWYLTVTGIVIVNSFRLLGAHRYQSDEAEMTFVEQLLDSVNYPRHRALAELWAPVGLRLHALHHLFPALPYHAFSLAHRRLMAQLEGDSPYRMTVSPGLWASLALLWRRAANSRQKGMVTRQRDA